MPPNAPRVVRTFVGPTKLGLRRNCVEIGATNKRYLHAAADNGQLWQIAGPLGLLRTDAESAVKLLTTEAESATKLLTTEVERATNLLATKLMGSREAFRGEWSDAEELLRSVRREAQTLSWKRTALEQELRGYGTTLTYAAYCRSFLWRPMHK